MYFTNPAKNSEGFLAGSENKSSRDSTKSDFPSYIEMWGERQRDACACFAPPPRKVFTSEMTEQESQETKDALLLECVKRKTNLDIARERLNQTARQLESVAARLRTGVPDGYLFDSFTWLKTEVLTGIIGDVATAQIGFSDVYNSAVKIGIPLPFGN